MTSVYTQTAQALFDDFQTYISLHGLISGPYGDVLFSIGFSHRHTVAHGSTLAHLAHLFAEEGITFTYCHEDEDGNSAEDQIKLTEDPYYENVYVSLTRDEDAVWSTPVYSQIAQQLFTAFRQLFSAFLLHRSRQGKFSHSGSYGDLLHIAQIYDRDLAAHGTVLAELARLFKEIDVSFMYCYGDEDGHATEQQISLTNTANYEDVYISLSC